MTADATFHLIHSEPLGQLPERWEAHWRHAMSREAGLVYQALSDEQLAGTEVDIKRIARYLGISPTRFVVAIRALDAEGFLWLDTDEAPPCITVHPVPEVGLDALPPAPRSQPPTAWRTVWEFINHWCALHERYIEEPYPRPKRGSREAYLMGEMLRQYSLETLKGVATLYFQRLHEGKEPSKLSTSPLRYFAFHLPRLVLEWKGAGGVPVSKMREGSEA